MIFFIIQPFNQSTIRFNFPMQKEGATLYFSEKLLCDKKNLRVELTGILECQLLFLATGTSANHCPQKPTKVAASTTIS